MRQWPVCLFWCAWILWTQTAITQGMNVTIEPNVVAGYPRYELCQNQLTRLLQASNDQGRKVYFDTAVVRWDSNTSVIYKCLPDTIKKP